MPTINLPVFAQESVPASSVESGRDDYEETFPNEEDESNEVVTPDPPGSFESEEPESTDETDESNESEESQSESISESSAPEESSIIESSAPETSSSDELPTETSRPESSVSYPDESPREPASERPNESRPSRPNPLLNLAFQMLINYRSADQTIVDFMLNLVDADPVQMTQVFSLVHLPTAMILKYYHIALLYYAYFTIYIF